MFLRILGVMGVMLAGMLAHPTRASERVALVIGNSDHEHVSRLANPANDASDIGAALGPLGFDVTRLENTSYQDMRRGLQDFKRAASGAEMAVVFYAGHGIEVDKDNFLIPVDARLRTDGDIEFETVSLDLVEGAGEPGLIILDACRDKPFAMAMERAGSTRSIGRGLARVEPAGGMLVAYAARGGTVASDGTGGRNSPYTEALLAHLEEPGLEVNFMFRKVRDAVRKSTNNTQEPVVYGSLSSEHIYLAGSSNGGGNGSAALAEQSAARAYEAAERLGTREAFEEVIRRFPDSIYAAFARGKIDALNKARAAAEGAARGKELQDEHGHLAMHLAAKGGQVAAMGWLKAQGADINGRDDEGETPMHEAAFWGQVAAMKWLAAQGADINARNKYGTPPMHRAASRGEVAAMEWLKAQGADINARNKYGTPPMHRAASRGEVAAMEWLKAQGADINARNKYGITPMHWAASRGEVATIGWLQAQGADINARDKYGETPMHWAARVGHVATMEWLQAQGADINARDNDGETPMHEAVLMGHVATMGWLQAQGADINVRTDGGETPMQWAALRGHVATMEWLKAQGADINARDKYGETPMHRAASGGHVDAMEWLKAQGADINAQDNDGERLMHRAASGGHVDAMEWLKAQGADINARDDDGDTPMHAAADSKWANVAAMGWLQAQGADINVRNKFGNTPLGDAEDQGQTKAANWLAANGGRR